MERVMYLNKCLSVDTWDIQMRRIKTAYPLSNKISRLRGCFAYHVLLPVFVRWFRNISTDVCMHLQIFTNDVCVLCLFNIFIILQGEFSSNRNSVIFTLTSVSLIDAIAVYRMSSYRVKCGGRMFLLRLTNNNSSR